MNAQESPGDATAPEDLSHRVIPLLKGVVYREDDPAAWRALLAWQARVRDYVAVLGLDLVLDDDEGYAFLRVRPDPDAGDGATPGIGPLRLVPKRPLSFPVSLTLALLRKRLAVSDMAGDMAGGNVPLVLTLDEIGEMLRDFLPAGSNEAKLIDMVASHVNKIVELGFLRRLGAGATAQQVPSYEVRRVLKAFVDTQWLTAFDARLAAYQTQLSQTSTRHARDADV